MAKLTLRYTPRELAILLACIKPYERWTALERKRWEQEQTGFRHFTAANITPIEHYMPKPSVTHSEPHRKPAA
jgi:hypothetical protein